MSISNDDEEINSRKDIESQSDVSSKDVYEITDYYNDKNKEYKQVEYLPSIQPPKLIIDPNKNNSGNKVYHPMKDTFVNFDEKFQKIINEESLEDEFPTESAFDICDNYKISFNNNIDYSSNSYDMYSKNHLRDTLLQQIKNINWKNLKQEITDAKKETNAYEEMHEKFFEKRQSLQLANINYLFEKELIKYDSIYDGFPALIVGDNGGFTDFILYYTISQEGYNPTVFVIPEKNNSIKNMKYRKEINENAEKHVNILNEFYEENKDIDENTNISVDFIKNISKKVSAQTEGNMVDLFIARKVIDFNPDYSQEIQYKKFFLINTLLAFKCLAKDGNFIIKLYDTFTHFTIGLIYLIFKNFERVSIFKPVSTRQYSSSRFLIAEKYLKETSEITNNSIKYLEDFLKSYIKLSNNNLDVKYFLPPSELRNNENFLKIIPEINNGITEKRIDALKDITNYINNLKTKVYDKISVRKFFLNNWGIPVINLEDKNEMKNKNKYGDSNFKSKKIYTQKELLEMYEDEGVLDKKQEELLDMLFNDNNKNKKVKKIHKEKERPKSLNEKYSILESKVFGNKRNYQNKYKDNNMLNKKRERKDNSKKDKNKNVQKTKNDKIDKKNNESDGEDIFEMYPDNKNNFEENEDK